VSKPWISVSPGLFYHPPGEKIEQPGKLLVSPHAGLFAQTHAICRTQPNMLRVRAGFTLIELMLAISIAIIILLMAMPSLSGIASERRLRESFERFDALARKAQLKAVSEQRPWVMVWQPEAILLQPHEPTPEERLSGGEGLNETFPITEDEKWTVQRPASLLPAPETPQEWTFWRSGTCEPVLVTYEGLEGWWTAQYHPLTGRGDVIQQELK
jgi:prepilin-type N-terminal cleavage/methylation domain-containing protein